MAENKKPNTIFRILSPVLSLVSTITLVILIMKQIDIVNSENFTFKNVLLIILEAILLFLFPLLFNPQFFQKRFEQKQRRTQRRKEESLNIKIEKQIQFNDKFKPNLLTPCPKCRFENPMGAKMCYNCGHKLNF